MKISRWTLGAVAGLATLLIGATSLAAQGVTTGAISGTVTDEQGNGMQGVCSRAGLSAAIHIHP
jgi:hypothetical protein